VSAVADRKRAIVLGAGLMGAGWARRLLPTFGERVELVGLVDANRAALDGLADAVGLAGSARFASMDEAFGRVEADLCVVVLPPALHREASVKAAARGLHVLSEKPLADSWPACQEIYRAVRAAGVKMQVVQNYRFNGPTWTMRRVLRSGELGRINYLVGRSANDYREFGSWDTEFRYRMRHAMLLDGGVHHLDMLRNLAGADVATIAGWEWNPPWSSSDGEFNALFAMRMTTGARAVYEGSAVAAGEQNTWREELYRAECEHGSATVGRDRIVRIHRLRRGSLVTEEVPLERPEHEGHAAILAQFLDWLDGADPPETHLDDNVRTAAAMFGAVAASAGERVVDVAAMVRELTGD
jgi:predicted dehydrogenase